MSGEAPFLRLEPELFKRLQAAAECDGVSVDEMASQAIERYLDKREFKRQSIEAALAEADKGVFVSWEAVHRWIESWDTDNELPMPEPDIFPDKQDPSRVQ